MLTLLYRLPKRVAALANGESLLTFNGRLKRVQPTRAAAAGKWRDGKPARVALHHVVPAGSLALAFVPSNALRRYQVGHDFVIGFICSSIASVGGVEAVAREFVLALEVRREFDAELAKEHRVSFRGIGHKGLGAVLSHEYAALVCRNR